MSLRFLRNQFLRIFLFLFAFVSIFISANDSFAEQVTEVPYTPWFMLPNMNSFEKMEYTFRKVQKWQIDERIKSGKSVCFGSVKITSNPPNAQAWISSYTPQGSTPLTKNNILCGKQRITVRKANYYEQVRMVDISKGETPSLHFDLKPIPFAKVFLKLNPANSKVRIYGPPYKYFPGINLIPGKYIFELTHPSYGSKTVFVELSNNEVLNLKVDFAIPTGSISVNSTQPDSIVFIDDQDAGKTPLKIDNLLPGPHKIQVFKSLFKAESKIINVKSNQNERIDITLQPVEHSINSLGMEFVKIPAGKFMMGFRDNPDILEQETDSKDAYLFFITGHPRHPVKITKPFFMQTTEVTRQQWYKLMKNDNAYNDTTPYTITGFKDINVFINKLNRLSKGTFHYRLPTEAEWEYACRAGTTGPFSTGDKIKPDQASYSVRPGEYYDGAIKSTKSGLCAVKKYNPNSWGLYGMHGNAYEVCSDYYDPFFNVYCSILDPHKNYSSKVTAQTRRGGWSGVSAMGCTSSDRCAVTNLQATNALGIGFRLVAEKINNSQNTR